MISFQDFEMTPDSPIYLQIIMFIKKGLASGSVMAGDELPSRRVLSTLLGVNPNTVQKAYKMLEEQNLICSYPGAGSIVTIDEQRKSIIKTELIEEELRHSISSLKMLGLDKNTVLSLIDKNWE